MKHLTVDAMIDFVSLTELNREAIELSTVVNGHIRTCRTCRERVSAFQQIYDELPREFTGGRIKQMLGRYAQTGEKAEEMAQLLALMEACRDCAQPEIAARSEH